MTEAAAHRVRMLWAHYRTAITIGIILLMVLLGLGALHHLIRESTCATCRAHSTR